MTIDKAPQGVMNPTLKSGGLPPIHDQPKKGVSNLRPEGQDTHGCFPVHGSVVQHHATVAGDTVKVLCVKSLLNMGEENFTGENREVFSCS